MEKVKEIEPEAKPAPGSGWADDHRALWGEKQDGIYGLGAEAAAREEGFGM